MIATFEWSNIGPASTRPFSPSFGHTPSATAIATTAAPVKTHHGIATSIGVGSASSGLDKSSAALPATARPQSSNAVIREKPIQERIGNAKVLNSAHPMAGANVTATVGCKTSLRVTEPTQVASAS